MELYGTFRLGEKFRNFMELIMGLMERNNYGPNYHRFRPTIPQREGIWEIKNSRVHRYYLTIFTLKW